MVKKRLKKFNISNKLAYTLIVIALVIGLGIGVVAYNLPPPTFVGHTTNEITWPACASGAYLTVSGGAVACTTPSGGLTQGLNVFQCPTSPAATNYCANVQFTRNGIGPCIGQAIISQYDVASCFAVDIDCAFYSSLSCILVGHLVS